MRTATTRQSRHSRQFLIRCCPIALGGGSTRPRISANHPDTLQRQTERSALSLLVTRKALHLTRLNRTRKVGEGNGVCVRTGRRVPRNRDGLGTVGAKKDVLRALTVTGGNKPKALEAVPIPLFHIGKQYLLGCSAVIRPPLKGHVIDRGLRGQVAESAGKTLTVVARCGWVYGYSCKRIRISRRGGKCWSTESKRNRENTAGCS